MSNQVIISDEVKYELANIITSKNRNTNLAKMVVEFIAHEAKKEHPQLDVGTLREFVDFLIKRGYN